MDSGGLDGAVTETVRCRSCRRPRGEAAWVSGGGGIRTLEGRYTPSDFRDRIETADLQGVFGRCASAFASTSDASWPTNSDRRHLFMKKGGESRSVGVRSESGSAGWVGISSSAHLSVAPSRENQAGAGRRSGSASPYGMVTRPRGSVAPAGAKVRCGCACARSPRRICSRRCCSRRRLSQSSRVRTARARGARHRCRGRPIGRRFDSRHRGRLPDRWSAAGRRAAGPCTP